MSSNGNIPIAQMVERQGLWLLPSTAAKFDLMDAWLVSLGYPHMVISQPYGAYRSYADQLAVKKIYGKGAATPGYSNHGLGTAWDINNIGHYPDARIAEAGVKFGLKRDAGNGAGGIESWHMHDYNQTVPAGSDDTPIPSDPIIIPTYYQEHNMLVITANGMSGTPTFLIQEGSAYRFANSGDLSNFMAMHDGLKAHDCLAAGPDLDSMNNVIHSLLVNYGFPNDVTYGAIATWGAGYTTYAKDLK